MSVIGFSWLLGWGFVFFSSPPEGAGANSTEVDVAFPLAEPDVKVDPACDTDRLGMLHQNTGAGLVDTTTMWRIGLAFTPGT
jgi:hypothetical protein